jgi:hypothetical protein
MTSKLNIKHMNEKFHYYNEDIMKWVEILKQDEEKQHTFCFKHALKSLQFTIIATTIGYRSIQLTRYEDKFI